VKSRTALTVIAAGTAVTALAGCTPAQVAAWRASQAGAGAFAESRAWAAGSGPTRVRYCESGNNYGINTGNGYYGAWQFDYRSWHANGGGQFASYPHYASKDQQDYVAWTYWKRAGWSPWACKP
jgi:hypothetical protein